MERRLTETRYDGTGLPATRRLSDSGRLAGGQGGKEAGKKEAGREEGGRPAVGRAGSTSRPPQRAGPPRASAFPQRRLQPRGWARLPACPSPLHPRPGLGGGVGGWVWGDKSRARRSAGERICKGVGLGAGGAVMAAVGKWWMSGSGAGRGGFSVWSRHGTAPGVCGWLCPGWGSLLNEFSFPRLRWRDAKYIRFRVRWKRYRGVKRVSKSFNDYYYFFNW